MSSEITAIHALVLDISSNDAEQTLNVLRNTGVAVRATQVVTEEELREALDRQSWDVFLAKDNCPQLPVLEAARILDESGRDIPLVMIDDEYTPDKTAKVMASGVDALVADEAPALLREVVMKELRHLEDRRRRKKAEAQLSEAEKRCELLLANSRDAIAYIHDGMHIYANRSYIELFGFDSWEDLECMPIMDMIDRKYHADFKEFLRQQYRHPDETPFKFKGVRADGETFEGSLSMSTASYDGEPCIQVLIATGADEEALQERLQEITSKDTLTGLANRDFLLTKLTELINDAASGNIRGTLAFVEVDQFHGWEKDVGLSGADEIRRQVADWLSSVVGEKDLVARVGDESFAILRRDTESDDLLTEAQGWVAAFKEQLIEVNKQTVSGTLSIGLCPVTERSPDANQVINDAHSVCTRVQAGGGNDVRVFSPSVDATSIDKQQRDALRQIQEAMESGRIHLMYQPICKLHGEPQEFFQVLLRVRDDNDEPVPLRQLFPMVEGTELALKLEYWVIAQAMKVLKEHRSANNTKTRFFITLSATALEDDKLSSFIAKTLKTCKLPPDSIIYMINETDASTRLKRVITLSNDLFAHGIQMAASQFGAGLATQNILKHLPANQMPYVRIATEIMSEDFPSDTGMAKLRELINLAKASDRKTIVPMIEDAQSLALIWPLGVDYVQGYYLSPPAANLYFDFSEASF
jgi:diguanylate cyclase (GGDEF)-like protein/PAS domain S-box-containing protein